MKWHTLSLTCFTLATTLLAAEENISNSTNPMQLEEVVLTETNKPEDIISNEINPPVVIIDDQLALPNEEDSTENDPEILEEIIGVSDEDMDELAPLEEVKEEAEEEPSEFMTTEEDMADDIITGDTAFAEEEIAQPSESLTTDMEDSSITDASVSSEEPSEPMTMEDSNYSDAVDTMQYSSQSYYPSLTQSAEQIKAQFTYDKPYIEELACLQHELDMMIEEEVDMLIDAESTENEPKLQHFLSNFQNSLEMNVVQNIDKLIELINSEPNLTLCQVLKSVFEANIATPSDLANSLFSDNLELDALFQIERSSLAKLALNKQQFNNQYVSEIAFHKTNLLILLEKQASFLNTYIPTQAPIHDQLRDLDKVAIEESSYQYDLALLKGYLAGNILPETDTEQQIINCIVGLSSL